MENTAFKKPLVLVIFSLIISLNSIHSQEKEKNKESYSFQEVWRLTQKNSPAQKAILYEEKAIETGRNKASRHWLPSVYLNGRSFVTNDPGSVFFSNLGQRSVKESDFATKSMRERTSNFIDLNNNPYTNINTNNINLLAPDTLNNPGTGTFHRGTVGLDLPIYEGGAKSEITKAQEKALKAKGHEKQFTILNEYGKTAINYGEFMITEDLEKVLKNLKKSVDTILRGYQVGGASNPVGYSGLLGLKTLRNRVNGLIEENRSRRDGVREVIALNADPLPQNWKPEKRSIVAFANQNLQVNKQSIGKDSSSYTKAMVASAEVSESQANAEKAKFLPKVGVFTEGNLYGGNRSTATSYSAGFYVQMNLFSPSDYGSLEEAKMKSSAARARAEEAKRNEESQLTILLKASESLEKNIKLMEESSDLMNKQVGTSQKLFRNGSINALQMTEVLSRRVDLIIAKANAEREYLKVRAGLLSFSNQNVGAKNE
ncbi:MAG: TolC family protein [Leptospiraceae bacterium]|nr:TolC family protein [Leptospiraceae bacterium]